MQHRFLVVLLLSSSVFAQEPVIPPPQSPLPRGVKEIAICDQKLRAADWSTTVTQGAATPAATITEPLTGGKPAEHRVIVLPLPPANGSVEVAHLLLGDQLDFTADGSVIEIAGSYDARAVSLAGAVQPGAVEVALVLEQGGVIFYGPRETITSPLWESKSYDGLTAADFVSTRRQTPSLACGGPRTRLGFATRVVGPKAVRQSLAIDNWCVRVRTRCCPRALAAERVDRIDEIGRVGIPVAMQGCCDEAAPLDASGNPVPPADADPAEKPEFESVDQVVGPVKTLYPTFDTTVDTWYPRLECHANIGTPNVPPETQTDLTKELAQIGIAGPAPAEIRAYLSRFEKDLAAKVATEPIGFPTMGSLAGPYSAPAQQTYQEDCGSAFRGRDIVFVHGLKLEHIFARAKVKTSKAWVQWKNGADPTQPAASLNPEYYGDGYFHSIARATWNGHIQQFFRAKGYKNRYLIVAYSNADRLELGAAAILRQISDAMKFGTGVEFTLDGGSTAGFGSRGLVIVSHSTGGIVTDVAMTAAAKFPNLKVAYVPEHTKAHIAAHAVFSGSQYASAALTLSGILGAVAPEWICPVARLVVNELQSPIAPSPLPQCPWIFSTAASSILVDLSPRVTQERWGSYVRDTPVRTLTIAGAHPTAFGPLKYLFHRGFDDGVTTINSQIANPNAVDLWPSGFRQPNPAWLFDIGIFGPNGTLNVILAQAQTIGLVNPERALGFYLDQVVDHGNVGGKAASGPIPFLSPTGMRQDVASYYPTDNLPTNAATGVVQGHSSLQRSPRHFSYLSSVSDHFTGTHDNWSGWSPPDYRASLLRKERNWEETRVITDPDVYTPYGPDDIPLLRPYKVPDPVEIERGLRVRFRRIRRFRIVWGDWLWIWRRYYYLMPDSGQKMQFDYVYEEVLR